MSTVLAFAVVVIFLAEGLPLIRKKLWRELTALVLLLGMAVLLAAGKWLGVTSPLIWLDRWLRPLGETIFI